jgi:hypothetical protein
VDCRSGSLIRESESEMVGWEVSRIPRVANMKTRSPAQDGYASRKWGWELTAAFTCMRYAWGDRSKRVKNSCSGVRSE